jgi:ABC-type phosphate transport system substrate-binding protein
MKMKTFSLTAVALALGILPVPAAVAGDYQVVVHPSNPVSAMTTTDLSRIFLKKVQKWDHGPAVVPLDQINDAAVRAAFSQEVHRKKTAAVVAFWQQQIFAGRDVPPAEKVGDDAVVAFVRSHPGAIGYVSASASTPGVKVVAVR